MASASRSSPKIKELYPVQKTHVDHLLQVLGKHGAALDGSITGAGKTLCGSEIALQTQRPTLVVAPKISLPNWDRELTYRDTNQLGVINYEMLRTGKTPYGHWEGKAFWNWTLPKDALIIFDEVQRCQGMNTQNARILWHAKPFQTLMLSATAAEDPTEMKASGFILGFHHLKDFWGWAHMFQCKRAAFGGIEFVGDQEDMDRLHHVIFPEHGGRLTLADLAEHFTETQIITTPLDFGPEVQKVYDEMDVELQALTERKKDDVQTELTIRLRARQKVELLKVPSMIEMAKDFVAEHKSVVLFVNFTASLKALLQRIDPVIPCAVVQGGQTAAEREIEVQKFQADEKRIIICNTAAGGVAVSFHDTHGIHPRVSVISPSDNAKDIMQCLGRIPRAGAKTPTQQHVLFAAGTIEEEVEQNCRTKIDRIGIFNDGLTEPSIAP